MFMSIMNEYLSKRWSVLEYKKELQRLMREYNEKTGRNLFIYAADTMKGIRGIDVSLGQDDFYTIQDMVRGTGKKSIDFYIETPGGSGIAAEEIAKYLHRIFDEVNFVIAGEAKSAGTILVLSGDNIYMCDTGSLGPIDAQVRIGRGMVSAYDYKEWVDEKQKEAAKTGKLNPFDAIMVAQISPGELKGVINSLEFAKDLVTDWLKRYKFKNWTITQGRKIPVTDEMKEERAVKVAEKLCNHTNWRSHGRSLKIDDLKDELIIEDIDRIPEVSDIVHQIKTVIRLIFSSSTDFKLYFWEDLQIARSATVANVPGPIPIPMAENRSVPVMNFQIMCPKCKKMHKIPGYIGITKEDVKKLGLPINNQVKDGVLLCDTAGCGMAIDLKPTLNQAETQIKKEIVI